MRARRRVCRAARYPIFDKKYFIENSYTDKIYVQKKNSHNIIGRGASLLFIGARALLRFVKASDGLFLLDIWLLLVFVCDVGILLVTKDWSVLFVALGPSMVARSFVRTSATGDQTQIPST